MDTLSANELLTRLATLHLKVFYMIFWLPKLIVMKIVNFLLENAINYIVINPDRFVARVHPTHYFVSTESSILSKLAEEIGTPRTLKLTLIPIADNFLIRGRDEAFL